MLVGYRRRRALGIEVSGAIAPRVWPNGSRTKVFECITVINHLQVVALSLEVGFRTEVHGSWIAFCV
jgi:hypothetical protein